MTKPNFLIIGAKKCGTTSLYEYLSEHPQVFMSRIKEPNFFAYAGGRTASNHPPGLSIPILEAKTRKDALELITRNVSVATFTTNEAYEALFENASHHIAIGEASHSSLYFPEAAGRIREYLPAVKMIVILRNPVDRAFSDYLGVKRMGQEPIDNFGEAFNAEGSRIRQNYDPGWHYKSYGFYYYQLKRFFLLFPSSQIKVVLNEDLKTRPGETMKSIYQFLGVDTSFSPNLEQAHNIGGIPQSKIQKHLYNYASKPSKFKSFLLSYTPSTARNIIWRSLLTKPKLDTETKTWMIKVYESDILKLQDLIQRDLSKWLSPD